jgi:hypothetical protein
VQVWCQGDAELQLALTPDPMADRSRPECGLQSTQAGFFQGVVQPLFDELRKTFKHTGHIQAQARRNYAHWVPAAGTPPAQ